MNEVEEIKNRLDIVEVIGGYLPLKKAGRNFKALSPFHQEKTPSFMVSPEKNIWHDFSSGQGGDVFSFVMKMEGVEFREALELLARRAGVNLHSRSREAASGSRQKQSLYEILEQAVNYYHAQLVKNKQALKYLMSERGLDKSTIKAFQLGYAPDSWEALSGHLKAAGLDGAAIKTAGLAGQKTGRNNIFDLFRDRIMFPIFDFGGRPIGFSARLLANKPDAPKYINTPESPIYHKSTVIYGLAQAKESIRKTDEVIVVEGNMDVLALHQVGQKNVVAISGTAMTVEQLRILSRLSKNIKLCLDSDEAGKQATLRAIELAGGLDITLRVIVLDAAKDPDEQIKKDKADWDRAVKEAIYGIDFVFARGLEQSDIASGPGKRKFTNFVLPRLAVISDEVEKAHYIKKLAQMLDIDEEAIRQKISHSKVETKPVVVTEDSSLNKNSVRRKLTKIESLELAMLELFLPFKTTRGALSEINLTNISPRFEPYFEALIKQPQANLDKIAKNLRQLADNAKIIALRGEEEYSPLGENDLKLEAYTQVHRWQKEIRQINKRRLTRLIAEAEGRGDVASAEKYLTNYQTLLSEES